jgi:acetyltransferase-like isoleucine patch superfamily enzyme
MIESKFLYNPIRENNSTNQKLVHGIIYWLRNFITRIGLWLGFMNIDYSYIHGQKNRLHLGENCSTTNSIFNVISGHINIGDNTIIGHNCLFLTGTHTFQDGQRASLSKITTMEETPTSGRDIIIGAGVFIGSGSIIIGPVSVGDNVIVGAGAVVTKDIPSSCFAAGVPAKVIHSIDR